MQKEGNKARDQAAGRSAAHKCDLLSSEVHLAGVLVSLGLHNSYLMMFSEGVRVTFGIPALADERRHKSCCYEGP